MSFKRQNTLWGFLFIVSLMVAFPSTAQHRCRLFGVVRDDKGAPIELASVRVQGQGLGTVTNLQGQYSLYCTSRDTVTIIVSMIGYETRKKTFHSPIDSVRTDFMLPAFGVTTIGEALVTGHGVQTGTVQKLTPADSKFVPTATGNAVEDLIATQAGVSTHNELSSQYNVRGGSYDENCVYLNGIEVYRPMLIRSGQQEGLSVINSDMVESVGFSSGGFEARYGDRMSSVLDITYKQPQAFESTAYASMLGAGAYMGWGNKRVSLMSSVRYKTTRHLLGTMDTHGEYTPNFIDYQAYFSWRPNHRWSFDVLGNFSDNHYNFKPEDRETRFGTMEEAKSFRVYFDGQEKDFFRTLFGAATITHHFTPNTFLALRLSTFATKEQETYDIQGEYWLNEATSQEELGVGTYMEHARNRLRARVFNAGLSFRTKLTGHVIQAGFDWKSEHVEENAREWEMRDSMGYSLPTAPDRLELIYSLRALSDISTNRLESYVQDTWRFKTNLGLFNLTYGLRLSHWDWNNETLVSPRISLGLLPAKNDNWTFRFATGYYYQAPFYKELRDTIMSAGTAIVKLNKHIKSPRSVHFVLGTDYAFRMLGRPFRFTTEVYYKRLTNLIPYSVDNVRVVYYGTNISSGFATGIDFKLFGEFVPGTDSWLTFSIMRTKEKMEGLTLPRPTDQRYNFSLYFTDYFPGTDRWRMTLRAAFADGLPFGPPHSERSAQIFRAPAYKRVDLGMSYRLTRRDNLRQNSRWHFIKKAWLGIDVFNIMDIKNISSYYWITDISNTRYAVPNYLTGRQFNLRLNVEF